jgi:hypothetical protein
VAHADAIRIDSLLVASALVVGLDGTPTATDKLVGYFVRLARRKPLAALGAFRGLAQRRPACMRGRGEAPHRDAGGLPVFLPLFTSFSFWDPAR